MGHISMGILVTFTLSIRVVNVRIIWNFGEALLVLYIAALGFQRSICISKKNMATEDNLTILCT